MPPDSSPPAPSVAAVVVDSGLAHLDRVFEYAVPPELDAAAIPGVRVRVPFAGRDLDGFVVARRPRPEHPGRLAPLRRVVGTEAVLTPELLAIARAVADRYAGVLGDVLRLAIPKRHAAAERALPAQGPVLPPVPAPVPGPWAAYPAGEAFLRRVAAGEAPAAAWLALPGRSGEADWPEALAVAAASALHAGRGAVLVVPDHRDVDRVDAALRALLGPGRHVRLTADQGPQARYTAWLKLLRGHVRCVVGTRAAAFAPVRDPGLLAWWDDGDDLHDEPRAPYPHVREVLAIRARAAAAALLSGGTTRSVAIQRWVLTGRMAAVQPAPRALRAAAPRIVVAGESLDQARDAAARARLPSLAWRTAKTALERGPVLVQVPRAGYLPSLACAHCREPARCRACHGPLALSGAGSAPTCRWCGTRVGPEGWRCPSCDGTSLRSSVVGSRRTAEELGRAFPGVPVHTSGGASVLAEVGPAPALVVATPGAEPRAVQGYAAALLLDAWMLLDRPELDAAVEALRRWTTAATLVRPAAAGGQAVLCGVPEEAALPSVEALVRWDPVWLAARELDEREGLRLPPTVAMAELIGTRGVVEALVAEVGDDVQAAAGAVAEPAPGAATRGHAHGAGPVPRLDVLGPLPASGAAPGAELVRVLLRVPREDGPVLARALASARAARSARKDPGQLTVRMDWPG